MFLLTDGIFEYLRKPPCWAGPHAHQIRQENYVCSMTALELKGNDNSWRYYFHKQPYFMDMFPVSGPAQGGTLVSIMGQDFPVWDQEKPMIQVEYYS